MNAKKIFIKFILATIASYPIALFGYQQFAFPEFPTAFHVSAANLTTAAFAVWYAFYLLVELTTNKEIQP